MLTENEVVLTTCEWLRVQGWRIDSHCLGTRKGDDIVASSAAGERLIVECKGALSPKTGEPFAGRYTWQAISGAMFNSLRAIESHRYQYVAIAVPNVEHYKNLLQNMEHFCVRCNLLVFWVEPCGVPSVWQPNNSFQPTVIPLSRSAGG